MIRFLNPENTVNEAWGQLSPLPKELISQFFDYDPFFRSSITQHPEETQRYLGAIMPKRMAHVLRNIRLLNELDKLLFKSGEGELQFGERAAKYFAGFKLYPQDPVKGMAYYEYRLRSTISDRKAGLRRIYRKAAAGRMDYKHFSKEANSLLEQIRELEGRPIELPR